MDQFLEDKTTKLNLAEMKSGGLIKQRQKDLFTVRLRVPGGRLSLEKMKKIVEVAEKYGADYVHLSVRQSVEIPYVNIKDIDNLRKELEEFGQKIASCGPRVRVPTACSGCEYNPNGLMDVQKWCMAIDEKFFGLSGSDRAAFELRRAREEREYLVVKLIDWPFLYLDQSFFYRYERRLFEHS